MKRWFALNMFPTSVVEIWFFLRAHLLNNQEQHYRPNIRTPVAPLPCPLGFACRPR